jgi:hypothetical protein
MPRMKMKRLIVSVAMDEKLHYVCTLAGRDQGKSLSGVLEYMIRKSLVSGSFDEGDDSVNMGNALEPAIMYFEGYWEADPADRLYALATRNPALLTDAEAGFFKLASGAVTHKGERLTVESFREAYHQPVYDKTHLEKGDDA